MTQYLEFMVPGSIAFVEQFGKRIQDLFCADHHAIGARTERVSEAYFEYVVDKYYWDAVCKLIDLGLQDGFYPGVVVFMCSCVDFPLLSLSLS